MAVSLQAGDRVLVTFVGSMQAQRIMSTFCYGASSVTGTPNQADAFAALNASIGLAGNLKAKYLACTPSSYIMQQIWYQVISPTRYVSIKIANAATGQFASDGLTANLSGVITRRGDFANRHNLSSLHIPIGTDDASLEDGRLTNGLLTAMAAMATQILATITTTGTIVTWVPVINNGLAAPDFTPITSAIPQDTARVMRRRTVRVGI